MCSYAGGICPHLAGTSCQRSYKDCGSRGGGLAGCGIAGGGSGTVGIGIGKGPGPCVCAPTADVLRPSLEPRTGGSAGSGFWGGLGLSGS